MFTVSRACLLVLCIRRYRRTLSVGRLPCGLQVVCSYYIRLDQILRSRQHGGASCSLLVSWVAGSDVRRGAPCEEVQGTGLGGCSNGGNRMVVRQFAAWRHKLPVATSWRCNVRLRLKMVAIVLGWWRLLEKWN